MSGVLKHLRRTGRTRRMLAAAVKAAKEGYAVYVMTLNESHAKEILRILNFRGDFRGGTYNIKIETPESMKNYDFYTGRLLGAHPNCKVFVDHWVIEQKFLNIIQTLHAFDPPVEVKYQELENSVSDNYFFNTDVQPGDVSNGG